MKKVLIALFLVISSTSFASHIVGGEVYYDSLGNDTYRVTFEVYRDCSGSGFDSPLQYTVFTDAGIIYSTFSITIPIPDTLPIVYDDPCVTPPTDICVERAIYVDTIVLPATVGGYKIVYQRCCWANNIQNIVNPGSWGLTIETNVPGTALVGQADNNCARFDNYPPIVLCSNLTFTFDHVASDIDGDSLVYSMCTPATVDLGVGGIAEPNPEYAPPYADVTWEPGFSGAQPWGPGSNVTIDAQTGIMDITPGLVGTYVAGVCVEEYRNGVLINSKTRTFGYRVVTCEVELPIEVSLLGAGVLIEGCSAAGFIIERTGTDSLLIIQVEVSGSATNGVDYNTLASTITIPIGVATDTISIFPFSDNLTEGNETVIFSIIVENPCENSFDTTTAYLTIQDYIPMTISWGDSINICDEIGEYGALWCNVQNGLEPYNYTWAPTPYANNDSISFPATDLAPNLTYMSVNVIDACGQNISSGLIPVYNRCPLQVPNVITFNGDNINDEFIIQNIDDYDRVRVQIFNRWGNLVFESENYQNEWKGYDKSGKALEGGVYTYVVTPESDKYEYDDQEKTRYSAHGFVHIIK
jgi:gliding motility-associated-like protein